MSLVDLIGIIVIGLVVYFNSLEGLYRSAITLICGLFAGAVAFGFYGPLSSLLFDPTAVLPLGQPDSIWVFAAEPVSLLILFSAVFLSARFLCDKFLPHALPGPFWVNNIGGGVVGVASGYLVLGVMLVYAQMLPLPSSVLGYERFKGTEVASRTFFKADEAVLGLYSFVSRSSLGRAGAPLFGRYGDLTADGKVDSDDALLFWQTRRGQFPAWKRGELIPHDVGGRELFEGIVLKTDRNRKVVYRHMEFKILSVKRPVDKLAGFRRVPGMTRRQLALVVRVRMSPLEGRMPVTVDLGESRLVGSGGEVIPLKFIYGRVEGTRKRYRILGLEPTETGPQISYTGGPKVHFERDDVTGAYEVKKLRLTFSDSSQSDTRRLVFIVDREFDADQMRLKIFSIR